MNNIIETKHENESSTNAVTLQVQLPGLNQALDTSTHEGVNITANSPHDPPGVRAHMTSIIVNGVEHRVKKGAVGYEDIVALAGVDPGKCYNVTFENGPRGSEKGTLVPNGPHTHVGNGEVFIVAERVVNITIIVNGVRKEVNGDTISFEQVVKLAFDDAQGTFTVVYEFGPKGNEHGSMEPGQVVHIKDMEVFDVSNTYKS